MKAGREFELLIEKIYKEMSPEATIVRNDKIHGFDSGINREIDLSIRSRIANHEVLIIVQAKDYSGKVDINVVGEFVTVMKDVRASKGILICNGGFTEGAIKLATNQGIDLCSAHDANSKKWKLELKIPILLKEFTKKIKMSMAFKVNEAFVELNKKPIQFVLYLNKPQYTFDNGNTSIGYLDLLISQTGKFTFVEIGDHHFNLLNDNMMFIIEDILIPVIKFDVTITQNCDYYLKYVDAEEYRGIKNHSTQLFSSSHLTFKTELNNIPDNTWKKIDSDQLAITPATIIIEKDQDLDKGTFEMDNNPSFTKIASS
jgi:hypothetical protein